MTTMQAAAMQYAQAGYVLAAWERKHGKGPRTTGWGLHPYAPKHVTDRQNIGINHALSRTCALDLDDLERSRIVFEFLGLDVAKLKASTVAWTGRPDRLKLLFRAPDPMLDVKKLKIRINPDDEDLHTVLEWRGASAGQQAQDVLPPSIHPDTGKPYTLLTELKPAAELPPLPQALLDVWSDWKSWEPILCRLLGDARHADKGRQEPRQGAAGGDVIGAFNARHRVGEILERNGYEARGTRRWIRPGSTTGAPGVVLLPEGDAVFSHGGGALDDGKAHDAFDVFRILEHDGDMKAAVKAAADVLGIKREAADQDRQRRQRAQEDEPQQDTEPLFLDASTLRRGAYEMAQAIIEYILLVGATLVHGPAKKGKSWLLLQMATAIDAGALFLGCPSHRRDVLYVGCEDTEARFKSRLERMGAWGSVKFMTRTALERFAKRLQAALEDEPMTVALAINTLWLEAGRPTVIIIDTQEVFEQILGIQHGKPGDSITRRDYLATSTYDGIANRMRIALVLVGHWGEIKSIEKATHNPHECLNTTKARLAGVTTSITLGPLPNQEPGESTNNMQLSIRSRDLAGGDKFLWVKQDEGTGLYESLGTVNDVLLTEAQNKLCGLLMEIRKEHGAEHWSTAADLADELDVTVQAVKQMFARIRSAAKRKGRKPTYQGFTLESKPNKGYRLA